MSTFKGVSTTSRPLACTSFQRSSSSPADLVAAANSPRRTSPRQCARSGAAAGTAKSRSPSRPSSPEDTIAATAPVNQGWAGRMPMRRASMRRRPASGSSPSVPDTSSEPLRPTRVLMARRPGALLPVSKPSALTDSCDRRTSPSRPAAASLQAASQRCSASLPSATRQAGASDDGAAPAPEGDFADEDPADEDPEDEGAADEGAEACASGCPRRWRLMPPARSRAISTRPPCPSMRPSCRTRAFRSTVVSARRSPSTRRTSFRSHRCARRSPSSCAPSALSWTPTCGPSAATR